MIDDDIELMKSRILANLKSVPASVLSGSVNVVRDYKKHVEAAKNALKSKDVLKVRLAWTALNKYGA